MNDVIDSEGIRSGARSGSGKLAIVTGASSGIGKELARQFAMGGYDLVIASEGEGLEPAAAELAGYGVRVEAVRVDLASYDGVETLYARIRAIGRPIDAVALNAGVGVGGPFVQTDLRAEINLIQLNVTSTVHFAKRVLADLLAQGDGKILFTASIASEMPAPYEAVYGASKAFVYSFANALREEVRDAGLTVTILMPGATDTNFFDRAGMQDTKVGTQEKHENDPAEVARLGYEALMAGEDEVIAASLKTKLQGVASKILPESVKAKMHARMSAPGTAPQPH